MSNIHASRPRRVGAVIMAVVCAAGVQTAAAQEHAWNMVAGSLDTLVGAATKSDENHAASPSTSNPAQRRGPFARLVENPDQTEGAPPFALADRSGTIQRYVEPVPGIDLADYVDQVVIVRHDTGSTLLASQLELPPQQLRSMAVSSGRRQSHDESAFIQQVQYIDNDDATVQLIPDGAAGPEGTPMAGSNSEVLEPIPAGGGYPVFPDQMGPPGMAGPGFEPQYCEPMPYGPGTMQPYPQPMMGMPPGPQYGGYYPGMANGPYGGFDPSAGYRPTPDECEPKRSRFTADIELNLLRPQFSEDVLGKLSEEYRLSPRFVLAGRGLGNFDGRVRYWHFGRETNVLGGDEVHLNFDVIDIEGTHEFKGRRSDLTLAAGVRLAGIDLEDENDEDAGADFIGLTLAADGLTPLGRFPSGHFGLVYGGRLSLLAGDWGGDDNSVFVNEQQRNDNLLVHELYAGVELARRIHNFNVHARLDFEMQNWHSDVLAEGADIESIGFLGPGFTIGADF